MLSGELLESGSIIVAVNLACRAALPNLLGVNLLLAADRK